MSKRVIKQIIIAVSLIALVAFFAYRYYKSQKSFIESLYYQVFTSDTGREPNPNSLSDYPENRTGSYRFDPQTIFASLDQGKEVFTAEDPNAVDVKYDGIAWTQSDFLRVANAMSQQVWHEPLDLDGWDIYNIFFQGDCNDHFGGFNLFDITYYKTIKTGWETVYSARHIDLFPVNGVAGWAGDSDFSTPFIFSWRNIELMKFKTTADQAVQIAEENGGKTAQVNSENKCHMDVYIAGDPNRNYEDAWYVNYYNIPTEFNVFINPFTGEVHSGK